MPAERIIMWALAIAIVIAVVYFILSLTGAA